MFSSTQDETKSIDMQKLFHRSKKKTSVQDIYSYLNLCINAKFTQERKLKMYNFLKSVGDGYFMGFMHYTTMQSCLTFGITELLQYEFSIKELSFLVSTNR